MLQSSAPSVVQVQPLGPPYDHVYVKALAPGTAILTSGVGPEPLQIHVLP